MNRAYNPAPGERRLRILWISHLVPYPPKGGVLMRSYNLIREIAKHHDVDLFALNQPRLLRNYFPDAATGLAAAREHFSTFIRRFAVAELPSESHQWSRHLRALTSLLRSTPYSINWLESAEAAAQIHQWMQDGDYDVVHYDTISLAVYHRSDLTRATSMDHHNIESHMMLRRSTQEKNLLKRWYFGQEARRLLAFEKRVLRRFSTHITCSRDDCERLLEIDPTLDASVVPNGIAMQSAPAARNPTQPPQLLFIGGLDWYPNQDAVHYIIDSLWDKIKAAIPGVQMHIVGKNPSPKIRETAARDPQFKVHGFVDDISSFYANALAYLCPIRDGGGTKLKVLDALAHRLPVVAHPLACEGIEAVDGEHVLLAQTPDEFVAQILKLTDPALNEAMGIKDEELIAQKYDFAAIGLQFSDTLQRLAARHGQATGSRT